MSLVRSSSTEDDHAEATAYRTLMKDLSGSFNATHWIQKEKSLRHRESTYRRAVSLYFVKKEERVDIHLAKAEIHVPSSGASEDSKDVWPGHGMFFGRYCHVSPQIIALLESRKSKMFISVFLSTLWFLLAISLMHHSYRQVRVLIPYDLRTNQTEISLPLTASHASSSSIFLYYSLYGFYQNARSYISSRSRSLFGISYNCRGVDTTRKACVVRPDHPQFCKSNSTTTFFIPCGLQSISSFDDNFSFHVRGEAVDEFAHRKPSSTFLRKNTTMNKKEEEENYSTRRLHVNSSPSILLWPEELAKASKLSTSLLAAHLLSILQRKGVDIRPNPQYSSEDLTNRALKAILARGKRVNLPHGMRHQIIHSMERWRKSPEFASMTPPLVLLPQRMSAWMVWLRPALSSSFAKLIGRIEDPLLRTQTRENPTLIIRIPHNVYPTNIWSVEKRIFVVSTGKFGGPQWLSCGISFALGVLYATFLCLSLMADKIINV